jgi:hypothetical protein
VHRFFRIQKFSGGTSSGRIALFENFKGRMKVAVTQGNQVQRVGVELLGQDSLRSEWMVENFEGEVSNCHEPSDQTELRGG